MPKVTQLVNDWADFGIQPSCSSPLDLEENVFTTRHSLGEEGNGLFRTVFGFK